MPTIRDMLLAHARTCLYDRGWGFTGDVLIKTAEQLGIHKHSPTSDQQKVLDAWHALYRDGTINPGCDLEETGSYRYHFAVRDDEVVAELEKMVEGEEARANANARTIHELRAQLQAAWTAYAELNSAARKVVRRFDLMPDLDTGYLAALKKLLPEPPTKQKEQTNARSIEDAVRLERAQCLLALSRARHELPGTPSFDEVLDAAAAAIRAREET